MLFFFHLMVVVFKQKRKRLVNHTLTLRGASAIFKDCLKLFELFVAKIQGMIFFAGETEVV